MLPVLEINYISCNDCCWAQKCVCRQQWVKGGEVTGQRLKMKGTEGRTIPASSGKAQHPVKYFLISQTQKSTCTCITSICHLNLTKISHPFFFFVCAGICRLCSSPFYSLPFLSSKFIEYLASLLAE